MDISDEDLDPAFLASLPTIIKKTQKELTLIAGSFSAGRLLNSGARVVITGSPNVGKSSLLNSLALSICKTRSSKGFSKSKYSIVKK